MAPSGNLLKNGINILLLTPIKTETHGMFLCQITLSLGKDNMNNYRELIELYSQRLSECVKDKPCHRSFIAYRIAGAIETLLYLIGFLKSGVEFDYLTGGKKYFPLIGDFRWKEAYPHF